MLLIYVTVIIHLHKGKSKIHIGKNNVITIMFEIQNQFKLMDSVLKLWVSQTNSLIKCCFGISTWSSNEKLNSVQSEEYKINKYIFTLSFLIMCLFFLFCPIFIIWFLYWKINYFLAVFREYICLLLFCFDNVYIENEEIYAVGINILFPFNWCKFFWPPCCN